MKNLFKFRFNIYHQIQLCRYYRYLIIIVIVRNIANIILAAHYSSVHENVKYRRTTLRRIIRSIVQLYFHLSWIRFVRLPFIREKSERRKNIRLNHRAQSQYPVNSELIRRTYAVILIMISRDDRRPRVITLYRCCYYQCLM